MDSLPKSARRRPEQERLPGQVNHREVQRFDIQLLRGVAVLVVVTFHALHGQFPKGFLGVDVFFVISGFLITGMIMRQLEHGRFTFVGFYLRRARRLLPASLSTFAITTAVALILLTSEQLGQYIRQLFGSLTFTANFALMQQVGYFEDAAETKPLLHIWSLSLEEQFYFIAPLLLWLTPRSKRMALLIVVAAASLALGLVLVSGIPIPHLSPKGAQKIAFFMLPPRAWELLLGGIAAAVMMRRPQLTIPAWAKYVSLAVILFSCARGISPVHPGPDAMIVTIATAIILLGKDDWLHSNRLTHGIATVGDWSYSVYLVHWPLFCFAYILYLGDPPTLLMAALAGAALTLGWAQYHWVEQGFRTGLIHRPRTYWPAIVGTACALFAVGSVNFAKGMPDPNMAPIVGLSEHCDRIGSPECQTSPQPTVLVWGDSYAMQLVPGLKVAGVPMIQATMNACAPVLGLSHVGGSYPPSWARDCEKHSANVIAGLKAMPSVRYVVIASSYVQVFEDRGQQQLNINGATVPWRPVAEQHFTQTVRAIQAAGKIPVVIGPTPIAPFNVGDCNQRLSEGLPILDHAACALDRQAVDRDIGNTNRALAHVGRSTGAIVLLPSDVLCDQARCVTRFDGVSLYRDVGHVTQLGSRLLVKRLGLKAILNPQSVPR